MNESGIYVIINLINKKRYYGSSQHSVSKRIRHHINHLKIQKHKNKFLQRSWNKYGEENFKFEVVAYTTNDKCLEFEQKCIDKYETHKRENGYNIAKNAQAPFLGIKHSEETKKKISISNTGKNKGNKHTDEVKKRISKSISGSKNPFYGKTHTQENKDKWKMMFFKNIIERINIKTGEIKEYMSLHDAQRDGFDRRAIKRCCKNLPKYNTHKKYFWKYGDL